MKEREIVRLREVDLTLTPLDVLEPDLVLEVDASDGRWGDHDLTKLSMEQRCTFSK